MQQLDDNAASAPSWLLVWLRTGRLQQRNQATVALQVSSRFLGDCVDIFECPICLELMHVPVRARPCLHRFCRACLVAAGRCRRTCPLCRASWPASFNPAKVRGCRPIDFLVPTTGLAEAVIAAAKALALDETLAGRANARRRGSLRGAERPPWRGVLDEAETPAPADAAEPAADGSAGIVDADEAGGADRLENREQEEDDEEENNDDGDHSGLRPFRGELVDEATVLRFFEASLRREDDDLDAERTLLVPGAFPLMPRTAADSAEGPLGDVAGTEAANLARLPDGELTINPSMIQPAVDVAEVTRFDRAADGSADDHFGFSGNRELVFGEAPAPPLDGEEVSVVTDAASQLRENRRLALAARARAEGSALGGPLVGAVWRQESDSAADGDWDRTRPRRGSGDSWMVRAAEMHDAESADAAAREQFRENREAARLIRLRVEGSPVTALPERPLATEMHAPGALAEEVRERARLERAAAEEAHLVALREAAAESRRSARGVRERMRALELGTEPSTAQS